MMNLSEQIKNVDLVPLATDAGVELHRKGTAHVGLCPLHDEKTPSFYIYPSNRFKCYGCGEGEGRKWCYIFPFIDDARESFESKIEIPIDWDGDDPPF